MIHLCQCIQVWAHAWAAGMWRASIQGGIALGLAWLVCRLFRRIPAWLQCWLWRLAYLKLFVGLLWVGPIALPLLKPSANSTAPPIVAANAGVLPDHTATDELRLPATFPPPSVVTVPQPPAPISVDWAAVLMLAWAVGCALLLARMARLGIATARLGSSCRAATDESINVLYSQVAARMGVMRAPPLLVCDRAVVPLLLGMAGPSVVLPAALLQSPREKLRCLLAHELAHHQRRDLWWSWLPAAAATLFWFHPMVWLAGREWRLSRESACDAAALTATGSSSASYGRVLVEIALSWQAPRQPLAALSVIGSRHTLERRLLAMRHFSNGSTRRWVLCGFAIVFIAIIGLLPWRLVAKEPGKTAVAQEENSPATQPVWSVNHPIHHREPRSRGETESQWEQAGWTQDNTASGWVISPAADIQARTGGVIEKINCKEGQRVKKGDILFQLDDLRAKAMLAAAEAELEFTQLDHQRKQQLVKQKAISSIDLQEAELQVAKQEAAVQMAKLDVQDTRVVSPLSGIVYGCNALAGQFVQPGAVLAQVIDVDSLTIEFYADLDQFAHLDVGRKIKVTAGEGGKPLDATIAVMSPKVVNDAFVITTEGLRATNPGVLVKATVENSDHSIKSGMRVTIDLQFYPRPLLSYR